MAPVAVATACAVDPTELKLKCPSHFTDFKVEVSLLKEFSAATVPSSDLLCHVVQSAPDSDTTQTEEEKPKFSVCKTVDGLSGGALQPLADLHQFSGADGTSHCVRLPPGGAFKDACLIGVGRSSAFVDCDAPSFVYGGGDSASDEIAASAAKKLGCVVAASATSTKSQSVTVLLKDFPATPRTVQVLVENLLLTLQTDDRYKSKPKANPRPCRSVHIVVSAEKAKATAAEYAAAAQDAKKSARAVDLTRQLVTSPPNYCNPDTLAKLAETMAAEQKNLTCEILGRKQLEERKMGAFLAVGKGSIFGPNLIHLTYKGESVGGKPLKKMCFVGKGLTTDTGGYNLKVGASIELMKFDMGGAAAVFGAALGVSLFQPKGVEIHFIIGAAENMIDSNAYRAGDIITASNGATIEVKNTDAEGRLVLADCLLFAKEFKPDLIVDMATLTGSQMIGLGADVAALYGNSAPAVSGILKSARSAGENLWPMPLHQGYKSDCDSKVADINNIASTRWGGTIHAALFLHHFVGPKQNWCHIDMAGPVWDWKNDVGTGFGARTFLEYALSQQGQ